MQVIFGSQTCSLPKTAFREETLLGDKIKLEKLPKQTRIILETNMR